MRNGEAERHRGEVDEVYMPIDRQMDKRTEIQIDKHLLLIN